MEAPIVERTLDFIQNKREIKMPNGKKTLEGNEAVHASELCLRLKNVIMQMIIKNRETRKVPKLKDILKEAIDRRNKEQAAKRHDRSQYANVKDLLMSNLRQRMNSA